MGTAAVQAPPSQNELVRLPAIHGKAFQSPRMTLSHFDVTAMTRPFRVIQSFVVSIGVPGSSSALFA